MEPFRASVERTGEGRHAEHTAAQRVEIMIKLLAEQLKVDAAFVFSRQKVLNAYKKCIKTKQRGRHPNVWGFSLPQTRSTISISLQDPGTLMDRQGRLTCPPPGTPFTAPGGCRVAAETLASQYI